MSSLPEQQSSTLLSAFGDVLAIESVTHGDMAARGLAPVMTRRGLPLTGAGRPAEKPTPEDLLLARAVLRVTGRLQGSAEDAYRRLSERLNPLGFTPVMRKGADEGEAAVIVLPMTFAQSQPNVRLALILFGLTALSCLFVGASLSADQPNTLNLLAGAPYAVSLLSILLAHEFGHYIVARRLGAPVSLPYFIPFPIGLGTMGAVINMPAPPRDRRQLFAIGVAGPLAGLIVALPILWYGLSLSQVLPLPAGGYQIEGNSLLYALIKLAHFGRLLPGGGYDVFIHPIAMAGWVGLLVTSLNLLPAGQLDGGHVVFALLGRKWADRILWVVLIGLAALSFLWLSWLIWVGLIFLVSRLRMPLLNDITTLTSGQRVLAVVMVLVFVLVFTPVPWTLIP